jgi:hypothetical protein
LKEIVVAPGLESRESGRRDPLRSPRGTLYPQKLVLTSPASYIPSVSIIRSWAQATEFSLDAFAAVRDENELFGKRQPAVWWVEPLTSLKRCQSSAILHDVTSQIVAVVCSTLYTDAIFRKKSAIVH